jgi:hypothetical protein
LNGEPYTSGTEITEPGNHTLVIEGANGYTQTLTFSISLIKSGVTNGSTNPATVTPTFSGGTATLNGQAFNSGTTVSDVGNYELVITGVNNFIDRTTFTIVPVISGLNDGGVYNSLANINIIGSGMTITLNGSSFENEVVTEPGIHELIIEGQGGYRQTFTFTVQLIVSGVLSGENYINKSPTIRFTGGNATLNNVVISSDYSVTEVGHYKLVIQRRNQDPYELNFSILPEISRLANDRTYRGSVTPTINGNGMNLTLNGQPYRSGDTITNPGLNYMRITSQNGGFDQLITFTINLVVTGFQDNKTYYDIVTPVISGGEATLNSESFLSNTPIRTYGNFQLTIRGINDFEQVMNFTIFPYLMNLPEDQSSAAETNLFLQEIHSLTIITLNDELFEKSRLIKEVGIYDLVVLYDEEVILEIQFIVEPQNYFANGEILKAPVIIHYPYSETRINGRLMNGPYRIDVQGDYDIEVQGVNGYIQRYSITFINENLNYVNQLIIPVASLLFISFLPFLIRKRRIR